MVNEAMLCRRPCLVSRIVPAAGGLIVNGENGYMVDKPEASQFVPVIHRHFALSADERERMGTQPVEKAQTFAYEPHIGNVVAAARYALAHARRAKTGANPRMNQLRFVAKSLIHGAIELTGRPHRQRQQLRGGLIVLTYHSFCTDWPRGPFQSQPIHRFERQIAFLKKNFNLVSLEHALKCLQQGQVDEKPWVVITIDDGFVDNYTHARPVLQRYGVPATVFVATDFIDTGRPPWPIQIREILDRTDALSMEFPFNADLRSRSAKSAVLEKLKEDWSPLHPEERFSRLLELRKHLRVDHSSLYLPLSWDQIREMGKCGMTVGSHTVYHSIVSKNQLQRNRGGGH